MKTIHPIKTGLLTVLFLLTAATVSYGFDTELYVVTGAPIPPNVLIILDSSASMSEVDQDSGELYNPNTVYPIVYPTNAVYNKVGSNWALWTNDVTSISCDDLKALLLEEGQAINFSNAGCKIKNKDFQTGNYRNYLQLPTQGQGANRSRFGLANGIIHSYINTTSGVRSSAFMFATPAWRR